MNFYFGKLLVVPAILLTLNACQITSSSRSTSEEIATTKFDGAVKQLLDHRSNKELYLQNESDTEETYWPDLSPRALEKKHQERIIIATIFEDINQNFLSEDNKINYSIIKAQLDNNIAHYHFKSHYMPFKSESGFHSNLNFVISNTKLRKEKDIESYLNKLSSLE